MSDVRPSSSRPSARATPASQPAATPEQDTMRRMQIGIAGVLTVLLLVGMAELISDRARESAAKDAVEASEVKMPGDTPKSASAPLEELGVQPASKGEEEDMAERSPPLAPPAATVPDLEPDPELERARQSQKN
ncbi:hypothetical protein [Sphingopyxis sp. MWB1]|uniref:hypothetical protein n=1 Tax=Sphingopyxis sp. MWB1 TaxID=1537715 RepID=UPI00068E650D|nr:hypothetical protein [Sphingopyxis sp. MWB1]